MKKHLFLLTLFILIHIHPAQAAGRFYTGIALGKTRVSKWCERSAIQCDDRDLGLKLLGGLQMTRHWGIEASYIDLGQVGYANTESRTFIVDGVNVTGRRTRHISAEVSGFTLSGTGTLPLSKNLNFFAKAGLFLWDLEIKENVRTEIETDTRALSEFTNQQQQKNGTDFTFGLGLNVLLTQAIQVRFEWEQFTDIGNQNPSDINFFSGGMLLFF